MTQIITSAEDLGDLIAERLATRTVAAGAETNIGRKVYQGRRKIDDEQVPCSAIIEGLDDVTQADSDRTPKITCWQTYTLVAYDKCDPDHPNKKAHAMIRDMKRAIFGDGATLGGKVMRVEYAGRDIGPRKDGVDIVMATVTIKVHYTENLMTP
jgi:hypothetical protein